MAKDHRMKALRNQRCLCDSGKKFKNCHLPIYEKAESNIRNNQHIIDNMLRDILQKHKIEPLNGKYPISRNPIPQTQKYVYSICNKPCLEVDYTGMPVQLVTISDYERIAEVNIDEIKRTVIYKEDKDVSDTNQKPAE